MENLESLFSKALRLEFPWEVTKIEFVEKDGRINIFIDFPRGRNMSMTLRHPSFAFSVFIPHSLVSVSAC